VAAGTPATAYDVLDTMREKSEGIARVLWANCGAGAE